jgi:hypothetical protein
MRQQLASSCTWMFVVVPDCNSRPDSISISNDKLIRLAFKLCVAFLNCQVVNSLMGSALFFLIFVQVIRYLHQRWQVIGVRVIINSFLIRSPSSHWFPTFLQLCHHVCHLQLFFIVLVVIIIIRYLHQGQQEQVVHIAVIHSLAKCISCIFFGSPKSIALELHRVCV